METLVKISDNECRIGGTRGFQKQVIKQIEHEGEVYSRSVYETGVFDYDADFESDGKRIYWNCVELDALECIGIPVIKIHDYSGWQYQTALEKIIGTEYSTNYLANIYLNLKEMGFLNDDDIIIYTTKEPVRFDQQAKKMLVVEGKMQLILFKYGFNNTLCVDIPPHRFLTADFSKVSFETKRAYEKLIPEIEKVSKMNDEMLFSVSHRILNFLTKHQYYAEHKQRIVFPYL
jgi:hypothetical protein